MKATVLIGIGSNVGDKRKNCERAVACLRVRPRIRVAKISQWHQTKALCLPGETQPDFINGAAQLETSLTPESLHQALKAVEVEMGRPPNPKKWQPRIIDLDLLFYGGRILETPRLKIPHPHAHLRRFVLQPLAEIAPDFIHPILKKGVASLYRDMLEKNPS